MQWKYNTYSTLLSRTNGLGNLIFFRMCYSMGQTRGNYTFWKVKFFTQEMSSAAKIIKDIEGKLKRVNVRFITAYNYWTSTKDNHRSRPMGNIYEWANLVESLLARFSEVSYN